ncbi:MAG: ArsR/SmtB family transcription factor [Candidatus Dormibacteria bacterium]
MLRSINDDVFTAIAHPLRRALLDDLSQGDMSVSSLAQRYRVSRPAVSQHLRILLEAGLVNGTRTGRNNNYGLRAERLAQVYEWLRKYEQFWSERMSELGKYLDREAAEKNPTGEMNR